MILIIAYNNMFINQECINQATKANLDIKQAKLSVLSSEQQLIHSKLSLFPSLNGWNLAKFCMNFARKETISISKD